MITYKCFDIINEMNEKLNDAIVRVNAFDPNDPLDRQSHRDELCVALESVVGPVETFCYIEEIFDEV